MSAYDRVIRSILKGVKYINESDLIQFIRTGPTEESIINKIQNGGVLNSRDKKFLHDHIISSDIEDEFGDLVKVKDYIWNAEKGKYILNPTRLKEMQEKSIKALYEPYQLDADGIEELSNMIEVLLRTKNKRAYLDKATNDPRWLDKNLKQRKKYRDYVKRQADVAYSADLGYYRGDQFIALDTKIIADTVKDISMYSFDVSKMNSLQDIEYLGYKQFETMEKILDGLDDTMLDYDDLVDFSTATGWYDLFEFIIDHNPRKTNFNGWENQGQTLMGSVIFHSAKKQLDDLTDLVVRGKAAPEFADLDDGIELTKAKLLTHIVSMDELFPSTSVARSSAGSQLRYNLSSDPVQNLNKIVNLAKSSDDAGGYAKEITNLFEQFKINNIEIEDFAREYQLLSSPNKTLLLKGFKTWATSGDTYRRGYKNFSTWLKQNVSMNALSGWITYGKAFGNAGFISQGILPVAKMTAGALVGQTKRTAGQAMLWGDDLTRYMTGKDLLPDNVKVNIVNSMAESADLVDLYVHYTAQSHAADVWLKTVKQNMKQFGKLTPEQKFNLSENRDINYELSEWLKTKGTAGKAAGAWAKFYMNHPGAILQNIDKAYQSIEMSKSIYQSAYKKMIVTFQKTGDIAEARKVFLKTMTEPTDAVDLARIEAESSTLTGRISAGDLDTPSSNMFSGGLRRAEKGINWAYQNTTDWLPVKAVMLFPRIWLKTMAIQKDFIPGGLILSARNREIVKQGGAALDLLIAKQIVGAEIMRKAWSNACNIEAQDQLICIQNGYPEDPAEADKLKALNIDPWSLAVRRTTDDKFFSIQTELLTPINAPMHLGAFLGEMSRNNPDAFNEDIAGTLIASFTEFLTMDQLIRIDDTLDTVFQSTRNLFSEDGEVFDKAILEMTTVASDTGIFYKGALNNALPTTTDGLNKFFTTLSGDTYRNSAPFDINQTYEDTISGRFKQSYDKMRVKEANARAWQEGMPFIDKLYNYDLQEQKGYPVYNSKGEEIERSIYPFDVVHDVLSGTGIITGDELTQKDKDTQNTVNSLIADGIDLPKSYYGRYKNVKLNNKEQFDYANYVFNTPRQYMGDNGQPLFPDRPEMTLYDLLNAVVTEDNEVNQIYKTLPTSGDYVGFPGQKLKDTKASRIDSIIKFYTDEAGKDMEKNYEFKNKVDQVKSYIENRQ